MRRCAVISDTEINLVGSCLHLRLACRVFVSKINVAVYVHVGQLTACRRCAVIREYAHAIRTQMHLVDDERLLGHCMCKTAVFFYNFPLLAAEAEVEVDLSN